jgi:hypothetical protein
MNDLWKIVIGIGIGVAACKIYDDYMEQKELESCCNSSAGEINDDLPEDCIAGPDDCNESTAANNEPETNTTTA